MAGKRPRSGGVGDDAAAVIGTRRDFSALSRKSGDADMVSPRETYAAGGVPSAWASCRARIAVVVVISPFSP